MTALTIQEVSRQSGLSGPTLRYYEEIGLIGPVDRDFSSGHRRYGSDHVKELQALACIRAAGVSIEDMRVYQANRARGLEAAGEQRDLLLKHATRLEAEITDLTKRLSFLHEKATLWDTRDRGDAAAEAAATARVQDAALRMWA